MQSQATVSDPLRGGAATPTIINFVGNPDLEPEKADTLTAGIVYQPPWAPGATASIDYYDIDLRGVISALTPQQTVDQCAAGSQLACGAITRNSAGVITRIVNPQLNLAARRVRGFDIELGYTTSTGGWTPGLEGELALRAVLSNLIKQETLVPGGSRIDRAGEVGLSANPHWSGVLSGTYEQGPWTLFVQERFVGSGKYDINRIDGVTINDNHVDAVFYTDATIRRRFESGGRKFDLSFTVNNLFNQEPANTPAGTLGAFWPTNRELYDSLGRYYTVSLRFAL